MDSVALEQQLRTYRPANVGIAAWPAEFVWPRYEGLSVGNLPAAIAGLWGAELPDGLLPPLRADLLAGLTNGVERVVLVLVDALGWERLQAALTRDPALSFHRLAAQGRLIPLTSVFPSTTNNVLTTLWTGASPVQHGLLAFTLYLREWAMAVEAITFSPTAHRWGGDLVHWGLEPERFVPVPGLAQVLAAQGVSTRVVIQESLTRSALSRLLYRGAQSVRGHVSASDFWSGLRYELQQHRGERLFLHGYWGTLDTLSHRFGPYDDAADVEVQTLACLLETAFLRGLTPADRRGTLLLLTADHGQVALSPTRALRLDQQPLLREALLLPPLGEFRAAFLHCRAGQFKRVRDYLAEQWAEAFTVLTRGELLRSGLLGPGDPYAEVPFRLGDLIAIARERSYVSPDYYAPVQMAGSHGSLTAAEMLVPLLAVRLDA